MKRSRRGGRRPQNGHSGGGNGGNGGGGGGGFNPNRSYDSNGPEVKIRGTASHIYEKYLQLARDANSSGDRVMAESYLQHAEHYFRIMAAAQAQQAQWQAQQAQRQPTGTGEQPVVQQGGPSQASFSLSEGNNEESDEEEGEEAETAE